MFSNHLTSPGTVSENHTSAFSDDRINFSASRTVFSAFLFDHKLILLLFLLCCGIFTVINLLYQLPLEPVLYAAVLSIIVVILILLPRFFRYREKYLELQRMTHAIDTMTSALPVPSGCLEDRYQNLLHILGKVNAGNLVRLQKERTDLIEYYTTWAHQIKIPIAAMRLLLQEEDTPQNRQLQSELFRIEQYTEMVLCYFRLDGHSSDFVLKKNRLDDIIRKAVRKYAPLFIQKKIRFSYEGTDCIVLTDEKWLLFILEQLLSNALKYTAAGQITISVNPDTKILSVSDTGIGIAPEDLPRIFERGFTGYNGHMNLHSTGIGLYLSKKTADKLHHRIWATSQPGVGSSFYLELASRQLTVE